MKYIFGPVPSRRLGFSLGVDLVPFKTCSYNCIYCELGETTHLTIKPLPYIRATDIKSELEIFFANNHHIDFITLGGSGEPSLNANLEAIIEVIKALNKAPLAVLTNGALLGKEEVREALLKADVVLPSLDTVITKTWKKINRPHPQLRLDSIISGLKTFRKGYKGQIWLEVLFVKGINDSKEEIEALRQVLEEIGPEKIHLNTVVRPPAEKGVKPLTIKRLEEIKKTLGARAETVVNFRYPLDESAQLLNLKEKILTLLSRRPCTLEDIAHGLGVNPQSVIKMVNILQKQKAVNTYLHTGKKYYLIR
jgi:wyosine [tRNA(Phe)-imidazoG37] synthetase (radical SAM superfamily)